MDFRWNRFQRELLLSGVIYHFWGLLNHSNWIPLVPLHFVSGACVSASLPFTTPEFMFHPPNLVTRPTFHSISMSCLSAQQPLPPLMCHHLPPLVLWFLSLLAICHGSLNSPIPWRFSIMCSFICHDFSLVTSHITGWGLSTYRTVSFHTILHKVFSTFKVDALVVEFLILLPGSWKLVDSWPWPKACGCSASCRWGNLVLGVSKQDHNWVTPMDIQYFYGQDKDAMDYLNMRPTRMVCPKSNSHKTFTFLTVVLWHSL